MEEETTEIVDVIFRRDREGVIFALFPGVLGTNEHHTCSCYQRVGQHSSADLLGCIRESEPCPSPDHDELKRELERIGYKLRVMERVTHLHHGAAEATADARRLRHTSVPRPVAAWLRGGVQRYL